MSWSTLKRSFHTPFTSFIKPKIVFGLLLKTITVNESVSCVWRTSGVWKMGVERVPNALVISDLKRVGATLKVWAYKQELRTLATGMTPGVIAMVARMRHKGICWPRTN